VDAGLEVLGVESARDEALVDTAGGAEQTKGHDGEPQAPVEDAFRLAQVLKLEDVDGLLDASGHGDDV
jgi:hypothetical protein